jgi:folate-binding protein YgfZ
MFLRMSAMPWREIHAELGAVFSVANGEESVASYGNCAAEHAAFAQAVGVIDLSQRGRLCLVGNDRMSFLHGQVTNDIQRLKPGQGCYAALVTNKGRLQSDLNVWNLGEELLLDFEPGLTALVTGRLEKFLVADDVRIVDVAPLYGLLSVQGPRSREALMALEIFAEPPAQPFLSVSLNDATLGQLYLMNRPRLGSVGFDLFVPVAALGAVFDKLIAAAKQQSGAVCGADAFEIARIEAGIPRFGADLDDTVLPPEAGLDLTAVSYQKGCYIGQEVLNRIRSIGHVNRKLVSLRLPAGVNPLPAKGGKLFRDGKEVGTITSAVNSLKLGAPIALGYVRREHLEPGTELGLASGAMACVA